MIDKAISPASIQSMLQTLRSHQAQASGPLQGLPGATEAIGGTGGPVKTGFSDFELIGYFPHPSIKAPMAI